MRTNLGTIAVLTGAVGAMLTLSAGATIIYNPTTEFSLTQNANVNGVWSYGRADASFTPGSFTLLDTKDGTYGWISTPTQGNIWKNPGVSSLYGVPAGSLSLHPNNDLTPTVLRWTAPSAGEVVIAGQFLQGDSGLPKVTLRLNLNGTTLWTATDSGSFNYSQTLKKGDTIDYAVYNAWGSGNTPLETTIAFSAVPESSTMFAGAGALGLFLLGAVGHFRRSNVIRIGK